MARVILGDNANNAGEYRDNAQPVETEKRADIGDEYAHMFAEWDLLPPQMIIRRINRVEPIDKPVEDGEEVFLRRTPTSQSAPIEAMPEVEPMPAITRGGVAPATAVDEAPYKAPVNEAQPTIAPLGRTPYQAPPATEPLNTAPYQAPPVAEQSAPNGEETTAQKSARMPGVLIRRVN